MYRSHMEQYPTGHSQPAPQTEPPSHAPSAFAPLADSVAPPAPRPSDLYGARNRATIEAARIEIEAVRSSLEGIKGVREEMDAMRQELDSVKVDMERQRIEITESVAAITTRLFETKFEPLLSTLIETSHKVLDTVRASESSAASRVRMQNGRIEQVEADVKRLIGGVEDQVERVFLRLAKLETETSGPAPRDAEDRSPPSVGVSSAASKSGEPDEKVETTRGSTVGLSPEQTKRLQSTIH
ncbi:hypothetical protein JCM10212_004532 [Sporobolomyces blumeae]